MTAQWIALALLVGGIVPLAWAAETIAGWWMR